ncbi:UDP-N-acetylmuramate--L-alanine ligase [Schaalia vaccimaxillae]|uniref:UDP-N-acetylmuramate--L-alanine ligase n=1 Tax=Schaalia vaccimaxillae TaxID=183916 RepID=UPI0003B43F34|nr:UDP-N-acetylmuramate--L-alanine ligase [Schaalia vaccimaxillae]
MTNLESGGFNLNDRSFHLIGIGGAGMSVVAELLASRGARVSGSDQANSQLLSRLADLGVEVFVGHHEANVAPEATVVVSTAIRESNPELMIARQRGQEVIHRSQALALAATGMSFIAVAGAHGKTTTSGMLSVALREAGADPSVAVGGVIPQFGSGAHLGKGDVVVAEADESDGSFLNYSPSIEIVTNVEPDHLDRYASREAFEEIFVEFADRLVEDGLLIACGEDEGASRLASIARARGHRVMTYGRPEHCWATPDLVVRDVEVLPDGARAQFTWGDEKAKICLAVPGQHNVLNAAAAWAAGIECGVDAGKMAAALSSFTGVGRRFELRGQIGSRRLFDDYAHHPTEVAAAIAQARVVAGRGSVAVVFQPHLYSRTRIFADRFAQALSGADHVVVTDVYGAREDPEPGVDATLISRKINGCLHIGDMNEAVRYAAGLVEEDGLLITMGAGSITSCGDEALACWREQGNA